MSLTDANLFLDSLKGRRSGQDFTVATIEGRRTLFDAAHLNGGVFYTEIAGLDGASTLDSIAIRRGGGIAVFRNHGGEKGPEFVNDPDLESLHRRLHPNGFGNRTVTYVGEYSDKSRSVDMVNGRSFIHTYMPRDGSTLKAMVGYFGWKCYFMVRINASDNSFMVEARPIAYTPLCMNLMEASGYMREYVRSTLFVDAHRIDQS